MKRQTYMPYGLDMKYEYNTYKNIGMDYGDSKTASRGWIADVIRFWRKKRNKDEKKYKFCDTYSVWEKYVTGMLKKNALNYKDFLHWLYGKRYNAQEDLEIIKLILIPLYIALFSIIDIFFTAEMTENAKTISIISIMCVVGIISMCYFGSRNRKVVFYEDYIKIVENEEKKEASIQIEEKH